MTGKQKHKCVFSPVEIERIKETPFKIASLSGKMNILLVVLSAFIAILLIPMGVVVIQSSKMGGVETRLEYIEKIVLKEFKKLYWTEKAYKEARDAAEKSSRASKEAREAVERLLKILDEKAVVKVKSPS